MNKLDIKKIRIKSPVDRKYILENYDLTDREALNNLAQDYPIIVIIEGAKKDGSYYESTLFYSDEDDAYDQSNSWTKKNMDNGSLYVLCVDSHIAFIHELIESKIWNKNISDEAILDIIEDTAELIGGGSNVWEIDCSYECKGEDCEICKEDDIHA